MQLAHAGSPLLGDLLYHAVYHDHDANKNQLQDEPQPLRAGTLYPSQPDSAGSDIHAAQAPAAVNAAEDREPQLPGTLHAELASGIAASPTTPMHQSDKFLAFQNDPLRPFALQVRMGTYSACTDAACSGHVYLGRVARDNALKMCSAAHAYRRTRHAQQRCSLPENAEPGY